MPLFQRAAKAEKVELGDRVQDRITGAQGIVIGITDWLFLCRSITIRPEELKDGAPLMALNLDEPQCRILVKGVIESEATVEEAPVAGKGKVKTKVMTGGPERPSTSARS